MGKLLRRLQDAARSGVYRTSNIDALADALRGGGFDFARVGLHGVGDKSGLMRSLAGTLGLPAGFGENWDALEDCLADLSWREGKGHVMAFEAYDLLPTTELAVLAEVLVAAAEFWRGRGTPFFAVFVDPGRKLVLPDLFDEA